MRRITHLLGRKLWVAALMACTCGATGIAEAHHPHRETQDPHPRVDVIGPLGNRLPASYRRRYNRPTHIGGKIAYWIAPSSQEAMAWHRASHQGAYRNHAGRIENHYFYPKPWEVLPVGPRPTADDEANGRDGAESTHAGHVHGGAARAHGSTAAGQGHDDWMHPVHAAPVPAEIVADDVLMGPTLSELRVGELAE